MDRYKYITVNGEKDIEEFVAYGIKFTYEVTKKGDHEYIKVYMH